ncbi:hypothetical protein MNV49_001003 [Pseudohyphozyma bogoriensis]|nr:hypothetical protein MNV49_001003 [Pseudohyphozyma bogoriensis]
MGVVLPERLQKLNPKRFDRATKDNEFCKRNQGAKGFDQKHLACIERGPNAVERREHLAIVEAADEGTTSISEREVLDLPVPTVEDVEEERRHVESLKQHGMFSDYSVETFSGGNVYVPPQAVKRTTTKEPKAATDKGRSSSKVNRKRD